MAAFACASAWAAHLYVMYQVQLAAVYILYRDRREVHPLEAAHVYRPNVRRRSRAAKWENSADWAEVILSRLRIPFVHREIAQRREKPQVLFVHTMVQRSPAAAYRAVTDANVVDIGIHFELHAPAMASTPVRRFHDT